MFDSVEAPWKYLLMVLFFPLSFQSQLLGYVWGGDDALGLQIAKRVFILAPACTFIFCCWLTILNSLSILVRQGRAEFVSLLFLTWWDWGRSLLFYWGGIFRFLLDFLGWAYGFVRLLVFGLLLLAKDIALFPLRAFGEVSNTSLRRGVPWPAMIMMSLWTLIEAAVFTFVMLPLVIETMEGFADGELRAGFFLKATLYLVFCFFVLGSYAVIHTLGKAIQEKKWMEVFAFSLIELIVAAVESIFFYREFVDALIPWFSQYAGEGFELGAAAILGIAFAVWFGIRCMTWFLFGASAIPILLAMIQRTGIEVRDEKGKDSGARQGTQAMLTYIDHAWKRWREEMDWVRTIGEHILSSFLIPPLQLLAVCINFCTLLISSLHLFPLPFRSYQDILDTKDLLEKARRSTKKD